MQPGKIYFCCGVKGCEKPEIERDGERGGLPGMAKATRSPRPFARNNRRFTLSLLPPRIVGPCPENTGTSRCVPRGNRSLAVSFAVDRRRKGRTPNRTYPRVIHRESRFKRFLSGSYGARASKYAGTPNRPDGGAIRI